MLSGLRLDLSGDRLSLTGTDLELTMRVEITVSGDTDGIAVLPARLASDIVRSLEPGAVDVNVRDDEAHIASGRSQFVLRVLPAEDFPRTAEPTADAVTFDASGFPQALDQVVRAASTDEARPILTGVLLRAEDTGLRLVATDSYRLAVRDLPGVSVLGADQEVLVPSRALHELARALGSSGSVSLRLGEHDVTFEAGGVRVNTRLIVGQFPNYRQLIPSSYPNKLTVGRQALLDAIRRVKLLARESAPVRLGMSSDGLTLTATTQDVGEASEQLEAKYEGNDLTVAFNPEYLSAGVDAVATDEISLETLDALKPAVVRPTEGTDFLYLLMPVRVS